MFIKFCKYVVVLKISEFTKFSKTVQFPAKTTIFDQFQTDCYIVSVKLLDFVITLSAFVLFRQPPVGATETLVNKNFAITQKVQHSTIEIFQSFLVS